jgi:hypothetical protein
MFDFLKKVAPPVVFAVAEKIANSAKPDYVIVAEIHDDFDTASQKAVDEANKILSGLSNESLKTQVYSLKDAGFKNVPMVKQWDEEYNKRRDAESKIAIVDKYAQKYPGYKFIFLEQVKDICKKYGLLCAPVGIYKGDVPAKNIAEIANFKAKPEDCYLEEGGWNDRSEFDFTKPHRFKNTIDVQKERDEYNRVTREVFSNHHMPGPSWIQAMPPSVVPVPMFICAPQGDIAMRKDDKVSNEVFVGREIKDPIVLHYVKDGFLIVSKWGLEAEDKDLVNEKMN